MNCLNATKMISVAKERPLSLKEKVGLKTHLLICPYCRAFAQNCDEMSKLMKEFAQPKSDESE